MLTLSKLLIQSPKHLYNRQSSGSNWIREISTGRRDSTDNRNSTFTIGGSQTLDTSRTFVEGSKTGTQIGGVTGIGRHLTQTTRNLTKGFGPTRGRVSHHRHVHALITEVFGQSDTGVNRGLTGGHRHVGCVGNQCSTLHNTNFSLRSIRIRHSHGKFREISQYFSHLVTTFTATNINNTIGVRKLGKRLTNDGLSATKGTRHGASSPQDGWEQGINNTKTSNKRFLTGKLLANGTGATYGPEMAKGQLVGGVCGFVEDLHNNIINIESFFSISSSCVNLGDSTVDIRRTQNLVRVNNFVLVHGSNNISSRDRLTLFEGSRSKSPLFIATQTRDIHTLWDVDIATLFPNTFEGTLDTIENTFHDTGTEFDRKRLLLSEDGVTDGQTGGIFVNLDGSCISFELDNFSDQLLVTNTHQLVHSSTAHSLGDDQRARHLEDVSIVGFLFFITVVCHDYIVCLFNWLID
mmetsp:Transcript_6822/g.15460  ORF Transcript_6822/g.15460 Transcript_6822/m.15460 type:complete len:464 (-) Transcript_6822:24-1415(-)